MTLPQATDSPDETLTSASTPPCTACGCEDVTDVFEVRDVPVHVGFFGATREEALAAPTGDIRLGFCHGCGLVHNRAFDPDKRAYSPGYEVALHHSPLFREFMDGIVERLAERFELEGKRVVEIGCGDGYFLGRLAERGNDCIGVDPTVPRVGTEKIGKGQLTFRREYFGPEHAGLDADFVCCLSVFEHIPQPTAILEAVAGIARERPVPVYFEVFNAFEAFRRGDLWSVHYEQCNYFGRDSLQRMFELAGLEILESGTCYSGDQYAYVDAVAIPGLANGVRTTEQRRLSLPDDLASFATRFEERRGLWTRRLAEYRANGTRVAFWGAAGKGITFLNTVETGDVVQYVVDGNAEKQGRHVPGSGQPIVAPAFLGESRPDVIVISNGVYEDEMRREAESYGVDAEFLVA